MANTNNRHATQPTPTRRGSGWGWVAVALLGAVGITYGFLVLINRPQVRWVTGDQKVYEFSIQTSVEEDAALGAGGRLTRTSVSGLLHMRVFDGAGDPVRVGFQAEGVRYLVGPVEDTAVGRLLETMFIVDFDSSGRIVSTHFPADVAVEEMPLLLGLVSPFQAVTPGGIGGGWQTREEDTTGEYEAAYAFDRWVPFRRTLAKEKTLYFRENDIEHLGVAGRKTEFHMAGSRHLIRLAGRTSWLAEWQGTETLAVQLAGQTTLRVERRQSLLQATRNGWAPKQLHEVQDHRATVETFRDQPRDEFPYWAEAERAELQARFQDVAADEVLAPFRTCPPEGKVGYDEARAMTGYLTVNPDAALAVVGEVAGANLSPPAQAMLIHTLASAGGAPAQRALLWVIRNDQIDHGLRTTAIQELAAMSRPLTAETVEELLAIVQDRPVWEADPDEAMLANTVLLAVGRQAFTIGRRHDAESRRQEALFHDLLASELESLRDGGAEDGKLSAVFWAVYNTRNPLFVPMLSDYLHHPDPMFRRYAAAALEQMRDRETPGLLAAALPREDDPATQTAILGSLAHQPFVPQVLDWVRDRFADQEHEPARGRMIEYVIAHREHIPEYRALLEGFLITEDLEANRLRVFEALYTDLP